MSCLDNTDILRIVGGNSFQIAITVKARRVADGSEIEDFDLSASSPVLNLIHAGEKTRKYFVTQGNQAIIGFSGSEGLGYYGMEMSGSYNSEAWRFCIEKVLQLVDTNAKANIPEWSFLVDDTYFIEGTISIYGGGGGGDTVQADWTETNPTSAAFILHKPDLSVYATKTEVASGLAGKQDTIVDLTSIRYGAAAGATAYQKPSSGIPESDMSEGVQTSLGKADSSYQKPSSGIPSTDMSEGVQAALEKANSAVQTETDPVFSNSPAAEISQNDINSWNAKQSAIGDLADIREGAAAGATAVQPDEMAQAIDGVDGDIADINAKIPTAASNLNQLADKAYVNSSIATNSATYRGSFNLITDLGMNVDATHAQIAGALATAIVTADNNDYAFVQIPDSASTPTVIAKIERYKHNGTGWVYEYDLNNSGFTAAQWAAINSGITSGLVGKLADLPNNSELATLLNGKQNVISDLASIRSGASAGATAVQPADLTEALNSVEDEIAGLDESKQDVIEDLSTIRSGAAAGATAYQKPGTGIPESDMSESVQSALDKAEDAYQLPADGIPATDMSESVQSALDKANSAVQTETDPVFSNSPAADITQADINTWNAKQPAIVDLSDIRAGAAAGATAVQPDEMAQAIDVVDGEIDGINAKIPAAASSLNQLADKAYVNSSISTNSATYRGSFNLITDLGMNVDATHAQIAGALAAAIVTADNNDYAFVQIPDSASTPTVIAKIERYKHNGSGWVYEYDLNNSGFTSAQWAAINSGITSGLVGKLADLPNNSELATLLNGKQNVISDLASIRSGASAGATAYQKPSGGIPASDMSSTVQQDLSKANTAVQTETDPIFSASPAAGITAQNIQTWNGEPAARQAADTALQTAIQNEATARATADALLQQQYNALTQSDIIVGALPATGVPNVIYRVPGTTDFTDYMWYDNRFIPMATYGLPISSEFVEDSNLNKTQEEVNEEVADNVGGLSRDVTELRADINGGEYEKIINYSSKSEGQYVNKNNGVVTSVSTQGVYSALAFYQIERGKEYNISIPKTSSSTTRVLSYSATILSVGSSVSEELQYVGNGSSLNVDIVAKGYKYLIVDYDHSFPPPTVSTINNGKNISERLDEVEFAVLGGSISQELSIAHSVDKYMSCLSGKSGEFTISGSNNPRISFYPIVAGSTIYVSIPKAMNNASYILAYTDIIGDSLTGAQVFELADTVGTFAFFEYDIENAQNHKYLAVCYMYESGAPTVIQTTHTDGDFATKQEVAAIESAANEVTPTVGETTLTAEKTITDAYIYGVRNYPDLWGKIQKVTGYNVAFYAIESGKSYSIHVPKGGNSAMFQLAYTTTIRTYPDLTDSVYIPPSYSHPFTDTYYTTVPEPFDYEIVSALNYPYLAVTYQPANGIPIVKETCQYLHVVKTTEYTYFESEKRKARENIGALSKKAFKVLQIGSSHGVNSFAQFPMLAYKAGIDILTGNYYQGSMSINTLASYCNDNVNISTIAAQRKYVEYRNGEYVSDFANSIEGILTSHEWDIIQIMRSAAECYKVWDSTMIASLKTILSYITEKCTWGPKIVFMSGFADASNYGKFVDRSNSDEITTTDTGLTLEDAIWEGSQYVHDNYGLEINPMQPVIKACREDDTLKFLGTWDTSPALLTYDGQHLDLGIGMYVGGCCSYNFFLRQIGKSVYANGNLPTEADISEFLYALPFALLDGNYTAIDSINAEKIRRIVNVLFSNNQ